MFVTVFDAYVAGVLLAVVWFLTYTSCGCLYRIMLDVFLCCYPIPHMTYDCHVLKVTLLDAY